MRRRDRERQLRKYMSSGLENITLKLRQTFVDLAEATGISFGGDPRNILMWSHYAANHKGLCLQFELTRDIDNFVFAMPVQYSEDYPIVNWVDASSIATALTTSISVGSTKKRSES